MKRPVPVVLSAILLGLLAALNLVCTAGMAITGFMALEKGLPAPSSPSPLAPSFLPVVCLVMSLVFAALVVWCILTLVGLLRLQSWARYSVLVIAGFLTFFGAVSTVTSLAMPFLIPAGASSASVDPHIMRGVFFVSAAIYAIFTAIGIALLIYFNLSSTRAVFLQNAPLDLAPPKTSTGRPRPTAITVISWIYMVSGVSCLIYLFLPIPTFLFGFILYGLAAHLVYAVLGVLMFAIGYGLFRLRNEARIALFWLFCICPLNVIVLFTPWGSRQFQTYMDAISALNVRNFAAQQTIPNLAWSPGAIAFFSVIGMAGYGVILWFLRRHRVAFTPAPPPPPLPPTDSGLEDQAAT
jgi:hypothetical protein